MTASTIDNEDVMKRYSKRCLNCGALSTGNYCRECGQSLATARFTMQTFAIHLVSSLTRMSGDFLGTVWGLLKHPWQVVRDYVYGKRVGLVSPVAMLLLLSLYWGVIMAIVPHYSQSEQLQAMQLSALIKWLYGSLTFQYLFLAIPITVGIWAVYRPDIRGRFNFAELLIAVLYLASTFLLINLLLSPLELYNEWLGNTLILCITAAYGILSILKAFPQPTLRMTAVKLAFFIAVCGVLLFGFLLLFALPMYGEIV